MKIAQVTPPPSPPHAEIYCPLILWEGTARVTKQGAALLGGRACGGGGGEGRGAIEGNLKVETSSAFLKVQLRDESAGV